MKRIVSSPCYSFFMTLGLLGVQNAVAAPAAPTLTSLAQNAYLNKTWQTAAGACQTGATVTVSGDIAKVKNVRCRNSTYSTPVNLLGGDGRKTVTVLQSDASGPSRAINRAVNLDKTAPAIPTISSPANNSTLNSRSLVVRGNCESNAVVSLRGAIEGAPRTATCASGAYSISANLTSGNGAKALSVVQSDRATNVSKARNLRLTLSTGTTNPGNFLTIFDCHEGNFVGTSSASPAPCAVDLTGWQNPPNGFEIPGSSAAEASVENGKVFLSRGNGGHLGTNMVYQRQVNTRAFEATFTFVPSGKNIAFVLQNATYNNSGFNGRDFNSGAGCEAGFFQAFIPDEGAVDNIFALALMQDMPLLSVNDDIRNDYFTYSSAMIYKSGESPCSSMITPWWASQTPFSIPTKISTHPVPLNAPANVPLTSTGQNYEAKITYDGSNVTLNLRNLTAGGVCPGTNCFTHTWRNINIPALVGGNSAWVSISAGCNSDCARRVNVNSFKYSAPAN